MKSSSREAPLEAEPSTAAPSPSPGLDDVSEESREESLEDVEEDVYGTTEGTTEGTFDGTTDGTFSESGATVMKSCGWTSPSTTTLEKSTA
jgi:hypothetical protein